MQKLSNKIAIIYSSCCHLFHSLCKNPKSVLHLNDSDMLVLEQKFCTPFSPSSSRNPKNESHSPIFKYVLQICPANMPCIPDFCLYPRKTYKKSYFLKKSYVV